MMAKAELKEGRLLSSRGSYGSAAGEMDPIAAKKKAEIPLLLSLFTSAPRRNRLLTRLSLPDRAASMSGVSPLRLVKFTGTLPSSSRKLAMEVWPAEDALSNAPPRSI